MTKILQNIIVCLIFLVLSTTNAYSVVAYPYPIDMKQSDGSIITVQLKGDEKFNWAKTMDGYTLLRNKNNDFVYAISDNRGGMQPSEVLAHNPQDRSQRELNFVKSLDKTLFYSQEQRSIMRQYWEIKEDFRLRKSTKALSQDSIEHYKFVVILMGFSDLAFQTPKEEIDDLFNQVGYSVNGHQGSFHDYFTASSFGKLSVEATVVGPYTASNTVAYYGTNVPGSQFSGKEADFIREAVFAANSAVDYSQFTNGEGNQVSCVYVIYAGLAESSGNPNTIWPHRSSLYPPLLVDGVYVYDYGCSSEFDGYASYATPMTIGTVCHEFSHVLGLPDFYDTDYDVNGSALVAGSWDVMSSGNYNNGGRTPPLWNAYERSTRRYITIEELTNSGSHTLPALSSDNKAYKMTNGSNSTDEYFILENRQNEGFDYYLPNHGMLIWHVDKSVSGWNSNCANCNASRQGFDLMEANNNFQEYGFAFPGSSNNTAFTDNTMPNSNWTWQGASTPSGKSITQITENSVSKNIIFNYNLDTTGIPSVVTQNINYISSDTINVGVSVTPNASVITEKGICYSSYETSPTYSSQKINYNDANNTFDVGISSLQPATTYYVRAFAKVNNNVYYGEVLKVSTPCAVETLYPYVVSFEESSCLKQESDRFLANAWRYVDTAVENGGIDTAYDGTKFAFVKNDYYSGGQNIKLVLTPVDISVLSQPMLTFYHAQRPKGSNQDVLKVYYKDNAMAQWTLLTQFNSAANDWTQRSIALPAASKTYYIAFEAVLKGGYGECIDNIVISEADVAAFPLVQTNSVSLITDVSTSISANVLSQGHTALLEKGICFALHPNPTINDEKVSTNGSIGAYSLSLESLQPSTVYYVRAYARNEGVVGYGQEIAFETRCQRISNFPYTPSINSSDTLCIDNSQGWAIDNNNSSYVFNATYGFNSMLVLPILNLERRERNKIKFQYKQPINSGNIDTLKVYYKIGIASAWQVLGTYSTATSQWKEDSIDLPNPADNYFLAFEGKGANGGSISIKNITIESILQVPVVQTSNTALATYNSIATGGNVSYEGVSSVTSRGICYSTHALPTIDDTRINSGSGLGEFTITISNLLPLTTYYVRAFAQNSFGTSYGQEFVVETPPTPIFNNTISGNQSLCEGSVAESVIGSVPTGGNGTFSYLWQTDTNGQWITTNVDYPNFIVSQILRTTSYRRIVTSGLVIDTSNVVTITVFPTTRGGNVFRGSDTITLADTAVMELRVSVGSVLYWQRHKENYNWVNIDNSEGFIVFKDVPDDIGYWYYRAIVQSGTCDTAVSGVERIYVSYPVGLYSVDTSNSINITINPNPVSAELNIVSNKALIADISIVDTKGTIVKYMERASLKIGGNVFDVRDIKQGYYILKINSKEINYQNKIIVIKY
ncbi:MAG: M6 family metalloprotease domain-containing protein [Bacteroidales bacterium]|jgi:M6 family metalloprotease-like protein|nr:M6 family metalloprotease domain-containing protein [Bacteroidales bacterium]